jgi:hypothetical protein
VKPAPVLTMALAVLVAGCDGGTSTNGAPPGAGPHVYLLLNPISEQNGWAAITAIRAGLPAESRRLIRTSGLVSSRGTAMYMDIGGTCSDPVIATAQRIADQSGIRQPSCSTTLPGAL